MHLPITIQTGEWISKLAYQILTCTTLFNIQGLFRKKLLPNLSKAFMEC